MDSATFLGGNKSVTLQTFSKSSFFSPLSHSLGSNASDMSVSSPGELEEKSIMCYKSKIRDVLFSSAALLCCDGLGLLPSPSYEQAKKDLSWFVSGLCSCHPIKADGLKRLCSAVWWVVGVFRLTCRQAGGTNPTALQCQNLASFDM